MFSMGFLTYFSHYTVNQRLIGWWFRWTNMLCWMFSLMDFDGFLVFFGPRFFHRRAETSLFGFIKKNLKKLCHPIAVWDTTGKLVGPFNVCLCFLSQTLFISRIEWRYAPFMYLRKHIRQKSQTVHTGADYVVDWTWTNNVGMCRVLHAAVATFA